MGVQTDSELKLYNRAVKKIVFEHVCDHLKNFKYFLSTIEIEVKG